MDRMKKLSCTVILALILAWGASGAAWAQEAAPIYVMRISGAITPAAAGYLGSGIGKAHEAGAQALLVELDTPGGLATSMRDMVKQILNAPLVIIVYVAPSGAQAASAGVFITLAADIAAMAPGANIGAATPVTSEGKDIEGAMGKKVTNDMVAHIQGIAKERGRNLEWAEMAVREAVSAPASEALRLKVIDLTAETRQDLLDQVDGRKIERQGLSTTLATQNAPLVTLSESLRDRVLKALADPNIAAILMMLGLAGLYFELTNPGAVLPGVVGALCLILAAYSMQMLPVNFVGVLLIILAVVLFILEVSVISYGLLSIGGVASLTIGLLMLFDADQDYFRVSIGVIVPLVVITSAFFLTLTALAVRAHLRKSATGMSGLIGLKGPVKVWSGAFGKVFVHGEWWSATGPEGLNPGDLVEVTRADGLKLTVRKAKDE